MRTRTSREDISPESEGMERITVTSTGHAISRVSLSKCIDEIICRAWRLEYTGEENPFTSEESLRTFLVARGRFTDTQAGLQYLASVKMEDPFATSSTWCQAD